MRPIESPHNPHLRRLRALGEITGRDKKRMKRLLPGV